MESKLRIARYLEALKRSEAKEVDRPDEGLIAEKLSNEGDEWFLPIEERLALGAQEIACHVREVKQGGRLETAPSLTRSGMSPKNWPLRTSFWSSQRGLPGHEQALADTSLRRTMLAILTLSQSALATWCMMAVLPYHGQRPLEVMVLILFAILFFWVAAGFWTAVMGFVILFLKKDPHAISATAAPNAPIDPAARTAIVMPICNEDVSRVFSGLRATYDSLARSGDLSHFDFFVLSDTNDADTRVAETDAWLTFCQDKNAFSRVFYRWRRTRIKRKSGNLSDFCRRWGAQYRYMIVLDADSVMSGECLGALVRIMEANPGAGIVQTAPRTSGRETLHARIQQFANRVYGPLFTAGLHFWQLGEAHYWGHNAIIRVAPFMEHCALGRLHKQGKADVEVLSHDFVEAALMRRAGWAVWIAYDLPGSHEEMPPNLLDELQRDRRWCQGNLINFRFLFAEGMHPAHRVVFATGVMAYLSAPLWFLFLVLSTGLLALQTLIPPEYFVAPYQLFPVWPEWNQEWAIMLFSATATQLFAPKILSVVLLWKEGSRDFGGAIRLAISAIVESIYSALLAPIRMLFHSRFVVSTLAGWKIKWTSPSRENSETTWGEAFGKHGGHTILGALWALLVYWLNPDFIWWLLPVVGAMMLSVPLSVLSSRVSIGRLCRQAHFFQTPEEVAPPKELQGLYHELETAHPEQGFVDAVVDPYLNALLSACQRKNAPSDAWYLDKRNTILAKALHEGPSVLSNQEKLELICDRSTMERLHRQVWQDPQSHPQWFQSLGGVHGSSRLS